MRSISRVRARWLMARMVSLPVPGFVLIRHVKDVFQALSRPFRRFPKA